MSKIARQILITTLGPQWLAADAGAIVLSKTMDQLFIGLGISQPPVTEADIRRIMQEFRDELKDRHDAKTLTELDYGLDLSTVADEGQINLKIAALERIARLEPGTTRGHSNKKLRCMAHLGMLAAYELKSEYVYREKAEVLAEQLSKGIDADIETARLLLGEELVNEALLGMSGVSRLKVVESFQVEAGIDWNIDVSPDGQLIAVQDILGVEIYRIASKTLVSRFDDVALESAFFSPDGDSLIAGQKFNNRMFVIDVETGAIKSSSYEQLASIIPSGFDNSLMALISEDRRKLVVQDYLGHPTREYSSKDLRVPKSGRDYELIGVGLDEDENLLATSHFQGIRVSNLNTNAEVFSLLLSDEIFFHRMVVVNPTTLFCERPGFYSSAFDLETKEALFFTTWHDWVDDVNPPNFRYRHRFRDGGLNAISIGGNFFLGIHESHLVAFDIRTGRKLWESRETVSESSEDETQIERVATSLQTQTVVTGSSETRPTSVTLNVWRPS